MSEDNIVSSKKKLKKEVESEFISIFLISIGLSLYTIQSRIAVTILSDNRSLYLGSWDLYALLWLGGICFLLTPAILASILWILSRCGGLVWKFSLSAIAAYCLVRQIDYFYVREVFLGNVFLRAAFALFLLSIVFVILSRFHHTLIEFLKVSAPLSAVLFVAFGFQTIPHTEIWDRKSVSDITSTNTSGKPSIFLVTFERMIYSHVFNKDGTIDSKMFPNFSKLANTSDVYHQAYAGSDSTPVGLSSIYSGLDAYRFTHNTDRDRVRLISEIPTITSIFETTMRSISITSDIYTDYCDIDRHRCNNALGKNNNFRRIWLVGVWMYEQLRVFVPVWLVHEVLPFAEPEREITWDMLTNPSLGGIATGGNALHVDEQVGSREMDLFLDEVDALAGQPTLFIMHNMLNHSVDLETSDFLGRSDTERVKDLEKARKSMARLDRQLGRLMRMLKQSGIFDSSILVIHTDTGNEVAGSFLATGPDKIKNTKELAHVVLLVKYPRQDERRDFRQLVGQRDVLPIILYHSGLDASQFQFDGRAIVDPDQYEKKGNHPLRFSTSGFLYELDETATYWSRVE